MVRHEQANVMLYAHLHHTIFYSLIESPERPISVNLISYCSDKTWVLLGHILDMETRLVQEIEHE